MKKRRNPVRSYSINNGWERCGRPIPDGFGKNRCFWNSRGGICRSAFARCPSHHPVPYPRVSGSSRGRNFQTLHINKANQRVTSRPIEKLRNKKQRNAGFREKGGSR